MKKYLNLINWNKYKYIIIFLILILIILSFFYRKNFFNKEKIINEERINISEFSDILYIDKEWKLLSYPEVVVLAETDWNIMNLNVTQWDIVQEWDVLMQIWEEEWMDENTDIDTRIWRKFAEYYQVKDEYENFESEFWKEISILEKELKDDNTAFIIAVDTKDERTIETMQEKIQNINEKLTLLKNKRNYLKSEVTRLENEILLENQENIEYYYELDKKSPRAPIQWVVSEIYVQEWGEVQNWDKLFKIINNSFTPEISVSLSFNEYLLTKNLTGVTIVTENENRWDSYYEWEIYTRSPKINEDWEYTLTVRILEEVSDLILSDDNTKITVYFTINSEDSKILRIPSNCFTNLSKSSWILTLREWNLIQEKEVWIKSKLNWWNKIENFVFLSLEKEEKKDGIDSYELLCR